ncbi:MAG: hypothetical protein Q4B03_07385 [Lachnospiraceae bacterium]|nr:hypothetical protein [Lachnospiraceae bacterium]
MKNTWNKKSLLLLGCSVLLLTGCGKGEEAVVSSSGEQPYTVSSSSSVYPESVNENITTSSNYYEEPTETADTGDAEGTVPDELPKGTLLTAEVGDELTFTANGTDTHSVTIEQIGFTDRRSVIPGDETEQVLLITYSYKSLNGEGALVDDMSFRLFYDDTACDAYVVSDQLTGDLSTGDPVTAEVSFSVPADTKEFTLYVVDNAEEENENYRINVVL